MIRAENIRVRCEAVAPEPIWIDFEDAHFRIYGTVAWFYRALTITESEASAQARLRPWLMEAKKKSGATSPERTAPSL